MDTASERARLGIPLSHQDVQELANNFAAQFMPLAFFFGNAWHYLVGILLIFGILKIIGGTIIRSYVLYKQRGCGWWQLSGLWNTAFTIVMYPIQIVSNAVEELVAPIHEANNVPPDQMTYAELQRKLNQIREEQHLLHDDEDVRMQAFRDIRRKFLAARDFDTSQRIHARVRLVSGDKQVVAKYEEAVAYMAVGETFELGALAYAGTFAGGDCGSPIIATSGTAAGKILGVHVASYKHTKRSGMATLIFQEHLATDDVVEVAMGDFSYTGANVRKEERSIAPGGDK